MIHYEVTWSDGDKSKLFAKKNDAREFAKLLKDHEVTLWTIDANGSSTDAEGYDNGERIYAKRDLW